MNKKKIVILCSILVLVIIGAVATSYALFSFNITKNSPFKVAVGNLQLEITDSVNQDKIIINDMVPTKDSVALSNSGYNFTLTNTGSIDASYTIYLDDITPSNISTTRLNNDLIRVNLSPTSSVNYSNTFILSERPNRMVLKGTLKANDSINYTLRVWLDYSAGNESQNKYYAGKIRVEGTQVNQVSLKSTLLNTNQVIEEVPNLTTVETRNLTGKIFKSTETNTGEPTYYFRGAVDNNYVKFANKIWRIVRINEDGTIRLIMQDGINNNQEYKFNTQNGDKEYLYYSNSDVVKPTLESWYQENIQSMGFNDYVATGNYFCEEAKVAADPNYITGSGANMVHYSSYEPNYRCENDLNLKGLVNSNIGLITYDEVSFAGGLYNNSLNNTSYYLYNDIGGWTMSPAGCKGNSIIYTFNSQIWNIKTDSDFKKIRPVINLKEGITVTGTGTSADPYVVQPINSYNSTKGILAQFNKNDLKEVVMCTDNNGSYSGCEIYDSISTALASGNTGFIVLTRNIDLSSPISASSGKSYTIDLNGYKLTSQTGQIVSSGDISLKNAPYNITNLIPDGSFENNGWSNCQKDSNTKYVGNYSCYMESTTSDAEVLTWTNDKIPLVQSHSYYVSVYSKASNSIRTSVELFWPYMHSGAGFYLDNLTSTSWVRHSNIISRPHTTNSYNFRIDFNCNRTVGYINYDGLILVDLTETFGEGNEPDKEWCDENIEYFDGTKVIYK